MISFIWSSAHPFFAGAGGSENYTAGQIRELQRRGIPVRIITIGFGEDDGRSDFPDIPFKALRSKYDLSELDDTLVFITYPLDVPTRHPSYAILHCPPSTCGTSDPLFDLTGMANKQLIAPSKFAAKMWARYMHPLSTRLPVVYPFAESIFSQIERPAETSHTLPKILFAGRLVPDKGIYTLLAAMQVGGMRGRDFELTATSAGTNTSEGKIIKMLLDAHPKVRVVPPRRTPEGMAKLMAEHDVVVMPSTDIFWKEIFGIVAVEAQHAGCRVVASNAGGLPETDCGGLLLVKPDDPQSLANGMARAITLGPLTEAQRLFAATRFTVATSVDRLLHIIETTEDKYVTHRLFQKKGELVREHLDIALRSLADLTDAPRLDQRKPVRQAPSKI